MRLELKSQSVSFAQYIAALGSSQVHRPITRCHVADVHVPILCQSVAIQPLMNEIKVAAGGSDKIAILCQSRDCAIIQDDAALVAHQRIADLVDAQIGEPVGVNVIQQPARIPAAYIQLAEGADVDDSYSFADALVFEQNRLTLTRASCRL